MELPFQQKHASLPRLRPLRHHLIFLNGFQRGRWRKRRKNPTFPPRVPVTSRVRAAVVRGERSPPRLCSTPPLTSFRSATNLPFNTRLLARLKMAAYRTFSGRAPSFWSHLFFFFFFSPSGPLGRREPFETDGENGEWSPPIKKKKKKAFHRKRARAAFCRRWRRGVLAVWRAHNIRLHSRSQPNVNFILQWPQALHFH